jgi:glycosyltransferase involved in cell wall biosynthesis
MLIVHHLTSFEPGADEATRALDDTAVFAFDGFLTTSPLTTELIAARGASRAKIMTVTPPPPLVAAEPRSYEPPLRAAMVANLIARKRILAFLEALAARAREEDRFSVDIVGRSDLDRDYAARCHELVQRTSGLAARVRFRGPVPHEKIGDVYRAASIFVSAATMETFGMSLQEARAHGLPILAVDAGHVAAHFEPGASGLLFDRIDGLADGFMGLARDERAMRQLFDSARDRPVDAGYTWEAAALSLLGQLERSFGIARAT